MIGVIINPNSRHNRRTKLAAVKKYQELGGDLIDVRVAHKLNDIEKIALDFKAQNIKYLGISGGDGTIHHVITRIKKIYGKNLPALIILRDGTMNNVARTVNLHGSGEEIITRLVKKIKAEEKIELVQRDLFEIDEKYGFLFGFGLTTTFLDSAYAGDQKGNWQNVKVVSRLFRESFNLTSEKKLLKPIAVKLTIDGQTKLFSNLTGVLAGTVEDIGMGFHPLARASKKGNYFELIVTELAPKVLFSQLRRLYHGQIINKEKHFDQLVQKLVIEAEQPFRYTIDGELYDASKKLTVELSDPVYLVRI